ncbi:mitochondrial carrier domain-containing protein [Chlamydoabsidia padenii]|nr:mitochondrial carrier domain-containing protein [Chlamydoabsidia padenii]
MADGYTIVASSVAAITARLCTHPIDTIKTRLQANSLSRSPGQTYSQWLTFIIHQGSQHDTPWRPVFRQLYSGLSVTLLFSVPALSVYLTSYEATKHYLDQHDIIARDRLANHMVSGGTAEILAGTLFTPMEVLKNQLQTSSSPPTRSATFGLARTIYRQEGLTGFYRGYWMGLVVFLPHTMIYFATYERFKTWLGSHHHHEGYGSQLPWTSYVVASSTASLISSAVSAPLDIIKTRWQVSASEQGKLYRQGPWQIAKHLWVKEGQWKGLTKGLAARVIWAIPTTAISMTVFEIVKDYRRFFT